MPATEPPDYKPKRPEGDPEPISAEAEAQELHPHAPSRLAVVIRWPEDDLIRQVFGQNGERRFQIDQRIGRGEAMWLDRKMKKRVPHSVAYRIAQEAAAERLKKEKKG